MHATPSHHRRRRIVSLATWIAGLAAPCLAADGLPAVVNVWQREIAAEKLVLRGKTLYVKSHRSIAAIDVADGRARWSRDLGEETSAEDLVVTASEVVAAAEGRLLVIAAADGATRAEIDLGEGISALAGPPIVGLLSRSRELLSVDADTGLVTNRLPLEGDVQDLAVQDGYALVNLAGPDMTHTITAGFTADGLKPVWRIETAGVLPEFERIDGRLHLALWNDGLLPIDPASGRLGEPRPHEPESGAADPDWPRDVGPWNETGGSPSVPRGLRRSDAETGKTLWTARLPCTVRGLAKGPSELFVACDRDGRDLLAILSWSTGEVVQLASGLPRAAHLLIAGNLLIVAGESMVTAVSTTEFAPPEEAPSILDAVRRILLSPRGDDSPSQRGAAIATRLRELQPLGPAAFPVVARLLPQLGPASLVAAADALSAGGYMPAARGLARRLSDPLEAEPREAGWEGWSPRFALLRALARVGSADQVPNIASMLERDDLSGTVRREALATLVCLRSPSADRVVLDYLRRMTQPPRPWSPPGPQRRPGAAEAAGSVVGGPGARAEIELGLPDGRRVVLFRSAYLGKQDDLWVASFGADGRPAGAPIFTGTGCSSLDGARARLGSDGDRVELIDGMGRIVATFSLRQASRDSDGDGLTDIVERRLGLDPQRADTDGDGLGDAGDPAPNARVRSPVGDEQRIAAALFRQFFSFEPASPEEAGVAVVIGDAALEWRGRPGLTLTLNEREAAGFLSEVGDGSVPLITMRPGEPELVSAVSGDPPARDAPADDERVVTLSIRRGPHGVTYRVIVRDLGAATRGAASAWAIRSLRLVWKD